MGYCTAYYVPERQEDVIGRTEEIRIRFWKRGVSLYSALNPKEKKVIESLENDCPLPEWEHEFSFSEMGVHESTIDMPVPLMPYDARCPRCKAEVFDDLRHAWYVSIEEDEEPDLDIDIKCSACQQLFAVDEMECPEQGFARARWYIWVDDIDPDEYDGSFKQTVESVVGPCKEVIAWDT
jgi:hypothetical protein